MFKLLPNTYLIVPAFVYLLLLFGCGADETVNTPFAENPNVAPAPPSSAYYPIALGNRWTYRNPDGSEWARQVDASEVFEAEHYHSFSHSEVKKARPRATKIKPWLLPIEYDYHDLFDSVGPAEYITYDDQLVRPIKVADFNDAIWQTILDTGGTTPTWSIGLRCEGDEGGIIGNPCKLIKDSGEIFNPPDMLTLLYQLRPYLHWQSELTPLRFPLLPNQSYTALGLKLRPGSVVLDMQWIFYTDTTIVAALSNAPELVETPAGTFQDCLRIQYTAGPTSINTLEFVDVSPLGGFGKPIPGKLKAFELALHAELTDLLNYLMPKLGLQTMWLAPGVGPVKIETPNGIAELIDYDIKPVE